MGQMVLIILLVISAAALGWALSTSRIHLAILLIIGIIVEGVFLYLRLIRINRKVLYFFRALENDDTSLRYAANHRSDFIDELHRHLNRVNENFQNIQLNNERQEQYFSLVLEHISSGLMVISGTGHINQINEEALRLLNLQGLTHIKALSQSYPGLRYRLEQMKSMERSEISLVDPQTGMRKVLGLQVVEIKLKGEAVKLLTLQDLSAGMERKEIDDWIRLIRVMSHEIMNSLAPITSISTTLKEVWSEQGFPQDGAAVSDATIQKTLKGLDAIAEQSEGLTTFFESYRVLSRIPDPVKKDIPIGSLLDKLDTLVDHYRKETQITISTEGGEQELKIMADEQMVMQVLLNLVKNAVEALKGIKEAHIQISGQPQNDRIVLEVADNGEGIAPELADEIFMPFFTTRKKGTGVGLSYSRQVMAMNNGRIEFDSRPGRTRFRLVF
jgi:nitrogen fixation/metabolism regulation signal transduction histidine kinase